MDKLPFWHKEYFDQTTLHPLGLTAVIVCGVLLLVCPRRYAVWPMIITACFVAPAQRLVLATLDFNLLRLMVLFGWGRLIVRGETSGFRFRHLDWAVLAWAISSVLIFTLSRGTLGDFVNRLGYAYDAFGMYFLFRCLVRNWDDVQCTIHGFVWISILVAFAFLVENRTGRNAFAFFGGVPEITVVRDGRLRCQGAFAHAILAGCFWATLMPLMAAGWWGNAHQRVLAITGVCTSTLIVVCSASSTPVGAWLNVILAACLFPLRRQMHVLRWAIVGSLTGLHLAMNAPVWHLIARVQFVGGSTSWYRYYLIDRFLHHIDEWWLLGTRSTVHWAPWGLTDITNQFVLEAVRGGALTLGLFVITIAVAFHSLGQLWRSVEHNRPHTALAWALGVAMWAHCVSFLAVSYFGQMTMVWYLLLAMIGSLASQQQESMRHAGACPGPSGITTEHFQWSAIRANNHRADIGPA